MKGTVVALALLFSGASALAPSDDLAEWALREHFAQFEAKFGRVYESLEEREKRLETFVLNLEDVVAKNAALKAEGLDEVHGVTKFSDMTNEEFRATMLNGAAVQAALNKTTEWPVRTPTAAEMNATTSSFDWRDKNVVTPVKNQAYCGSCWAHSAVESLESMFAIGGGDLTALSVQQVVSCDTGNGDQGCDGGWYYTAWDDYIKPAGGLTTEASYPYDKATAAGKASACDTNKAAQVVKGTTPSSYSWATPQCSGFFCNNQDEDTLKANLVAHGPVSIAVDASSWNSYKGGGAVMTKSSCSSSGRKLDHAIQLVGYNEDAPTPYWIVRNSWATSWGNDGYIYLKMGDNTCGIADMAAQVSI